MVVIYQNQFSEFLQIVIMRLKNHPDNQLGLGTISNTCTTLASSYMARWLAMEQEYNKRVFPVYGSSILHHVLPVHSGLCAHSSIRQQLKSCTESLQTQRRKKKEKSYGIIKKQKVA